MVGRKYHHCGYESDHRRLQGSEFWTPNYFKFSFVQVAHCSITELLQYPFNLESFVILLVKWPKLSVKYK